MSLFDFFRRKELKIKESDFKPFEIVKEVSGEYKVFYNNILRKSLIMLIIGRRGSGKTALGMRFLEMYRKNTNKIIYALGFRKSKLPWYIKKVDNIENIRNNSVLLIDEGAVFLSARESMKDLNRFLSKTMAIARHKNLTLILITQNSAMIDLNVLRLADILLLKEPSLLQGDFERKILKDIYKKIAPMFNKLKNKNSYFYVYADDFQGLLNFEISEFWNDSISKSFG